MNGSLKWIGGIAAALIVAVVGWLFATVHDLDKSMSEMRTLMRDAMLVVTEMKKDAAEDRAAIKADLQRAKDDIEDLQKGKR